MGLGPSQQLQQFRVMPGIPINITDGVIVPGSNLAQQGLVSSVQQAPTTPSAITNVSIRTNNNNTILFTWDFTGNRFDSIRFTISVSDTRTFTLVQDFASRSGFPQATSAPLAPGNYNISVVSEFNGSGGRPFFALGNITFPFSGTISLPATFNVDQLQSINQGFTSSSSGLASVSIVFNPLIATVVRPTVSWTLNGFPISYILVAIGPQQPTATNLVKTEIIGPDQINRLSSDVNITIASRQSYIMAVYSFNPGTSRQDVLTFSRSLTNINEGSPSREFTDRILQTPIYRTDDFIPDGTSRFTLNPIFLKQ